MLTKPRRRTLVLAVVLALAGLAVGGYLVEQHVSKVLAGSKCQVGTGASALSLDTGQAAVAATIAGVAHQREMPRSAVAIAYTAAMQESHLRNLPYGDRDSVGVFQQRPSQGWGPARRLADPVYATTKFFEALDKVPGYQHIPLYRAAQAVQRSADGSAYRQYQPMARLLAAAFTGRRAHAVWCWYAGPEKKINLTAARRDLANAFGPVARRPVSSPGKEPAMLVRAPRPAVGWAVATWLVTHAARYGIHQVSYDGLRWRASAGEAGWTQDTGTRVTAEVRAG